MARVRLISFFLSIFKSPNLLEYSLSYGAYQAFRTVVPTEEDRIPLTLQNGIYPVLCYTPFIFLAYLARRPDTYFIRLLWLPTVITATLVSAYRFYWVQPAFNVYNWAQRKYPETLVPSVEVTHCSCYSDFFAAVIIAKSLQYALTEEGMLKVGETRPGVMKGKTNGQATVNGFDPQLVQEPPSKNPYIATWLYDAIELAHTMRGVQWKFGRGIYIPKPIRPLERTPFLYATLISFVKNYLILDFLEVLLKFFPWVGTPAGGTIFYSFLTPSSRYTVSTVIHLITGTALIAGFRMVYDLISLIAVACLDSSPLSWPPIMGSPWRAESIHSFWAKEWHQLLRQTFMVFGGYPGMWIAGDYGMVFGTFLASGLFHSCSTYSARHGFDYSTVAFFASQGVVLVFERLWKRITGRRVGGWVGRLWVYLVIIVGAQPMGNLFINSPVYSHLNICFHSGCVA